MALKLSDSISLEKDLFIIKMLEYKIVKIQMPILTFWYEFSPKLKDMWKTQIEINAKTKVGTIVSLVRNSIFKSLITIWEIVEK